MPLPLLAWLAIAGAAQGGANALGQKSASDAQKALSREEIASREKMHNQDVALQESMANPFRHQAAQAATISELDRLERARYSPVQLQAAGPYASYVPKMSGGFSYEKSPELLGSAGALKRDVMGGHVAPSVLQTSPATPGATRGRTPGATPIGTATPRGVPLDQNGVLDLLALLYPDQYGPGAGTRA